MATACALDNTVYLSNSFLIIILPELVAISNLIESNYENASIIGQR